MSLLLLFTSLSLSLSQILTFHTNNSFSTFCLSLPNLDVLFHSFSHFHSLSLSLSLSQRILFLNFRLFSVTGKILAKFLTSRSLTLLVFRSLSESSITKEQRTTLKEA